MTFLELAEKVLQDEKAALESSDIWAIADKKGYVKILDSKGKTPWSTLGARLYVNVRDNTNSKFAVTGTRPKKFYLKTLGSLDLVMENAQKMEKAKETAEAQEIKKQPFLEKELHPHLAYFAYYHLHVYCKTINHNHSNKKEFGEWVHPDMVGCHFLIEDWAPSVSELSSTVGNPSIKLFSFELKRRISFSNLRESFFQAVSNSSWANESYLVAAEFSNDEDLMNELKRLSTSFGIGVIRLDIQDPDSSEIILPANTKEYLDWETMNKLTMNKDFIEFLKRVKNDLASREIRKEWYDEVLDVEQLRIQ
jgi:uncharacterized protein